MKLKLALITIFLSIFGLIMLNQINMVNAEETSSPITSPITYFTNKIGGKITSYYYFFSKPAQDVTVNAVNIVSMEKYITKTDANGNYTLNVKSGIYMVWPYDIRYIAFSPTYRYADATKDTLNISFTGVLKNR